ncbi:hypothetical protein M422DRAFT_23824 [Sphaerobolus stellatus SS14]|nr:hypothetical protein M422DRAFT_23824 [Sphaerobolus stellatus SS14]
MEAQLEELFQFLHDRNPQVRQLALSNLLGQTPAGSPHRSIFFKGLGGGGGLRKEPVKESELVRDLKLLCRDQLAISHDAFRALVNLTDSPSWVNALSDQSFIVFLVSYILHPPSVLADLAAMLLSNLSTQQSVCQQLLTMKIHVIKDSSISYRYYPTQSRSATSTPPPLESQIEAIEVDALPLLVDVFASSAKVTTGATTDDRTLPFTRKGELHFLSSIFANMSVVPAGRLFFLTPIPADPLEKTSNLEYPISKLIPFTEHADTIRRGGVASTIKNCAFHTPAHRALLLGEETKVRIPPSRISAPGINVLPAILLPLAGPEELDLEDQDKLPASLQLLPDTKKREPDSVIRLIHVETLLLFCTTRWGRDFLRANGTYEIVRLTHESEPVDKISEHIERLVNMLQRDEDPETINDGSMTQEGDSEDERIEEV